MVFGYKQHFKKESYEIRRKRKSIICSISSFNWNTSRTKYRKNIYQGMSRMQEM